MMMRQMPSDGVCRAAKPRWRSASARIMPLAPVRNAELAALSRLDLDEGIG